MTAAELIAARKSCHRRAMRNPARKAIYFLLAALTGVALAGLGAAR